MEKNNQLNNYHLIQQIERIEGMLIFILGLVVCVSAALALNFIFFEYINIFYYLFLYFTLSFTTIFCLLKLSRIQKIFSE